MDKVYDIIVLGAGPAGLTAASYAGRSRIDTLLIEGEKDGGQIVITNEIENYPGCLEEESGPSLIARMTKQVEKFGADRVTDTIVDVELDGKIKHLKGNHGDYYAKALVIATGASPRPIGCKGEKEFTGKVTIIHRRDELRAAKSIQEKAFANPKMNFMWNSTVEEIKGDGVVTSMIIKDTKTGELREVKADEDDGTFGIFVFIGFDPKSQLFEGKLEMNNRYIVTDKYMHTSVPGVFAAGDVIEKHLRQVVTACGDGAVAVTEAQRYIESLED